MGVTVIPGGLGDDGVGDGLRVGEGGGDVLGASTVGAGLGGDGDGDGWGAQEKAEISNNVIQKRNQKLPASRLFRPNVFIFFHLGFYTVSKCKLLDYN